MAAAQALGDHMRPAFCAFWLAICAPAAAGSTVVIVEGLGGNDQYTAQFAEQVDAIAAATRTLSPAPTLTLFRTDAATREAIIDYFAGLENTMAAGDQLIVYLVGHGSYDEHEYKFNIAGPDLTDADILAALEGVPSVNQVVVNTSSASGAAAELWQGDTRVVITATRSGVERHATRFGGFFAAALSDPAADTDKNAIVTALEAFDFADRRVRDFFDSDGRLATEHPQLLGDRAARFSLARLAAARPSIDDARLRTLIAERDAVSARIEALRLARDSMAPDDYQSELLEIMLELARAEEAIERREAELNPDD